MAPWPHGRREASRIHNEAGALQVDGVREAVPLLRCNFAESQSVAEAYSTTQTSPLSFNFFREG